MKAIATADAVGMILGHDMTQIIPGVSKGPRFKRGHRLREEDIEVLLSMGKEHIYVWEPEEGVLHEEDAAYRLAALIGTETQGFFAGSPSEGKITLSARYDGLLLVDRSRLSKLNAYDQVMCATKPHASFVHAGDPVAATRAIPLTIPASYLDDIENCIGNKPLCEIKPFVLKHAAVFNTGQEVLSGRIQDGFTPVLEQKLAAYGIDIRMHELVGDDQSHIVDAIHRAQARTDIDLILCTSGMSVDPDDATPGAIKAADIRIVRYGTPVLPGAMFLVGYDDTVQEAVLSGERKAPRAVLGLPGSVMFAKKTVFDLLMPRIAAGIEIKAEDIAILGEGGLL